MAITVICERAARKGFGLSQVRGGHKDREIDRTLSAAARQRDATEIDADTRQRHDGQAPAAVTTSTLPRQSRRRSRTNARSRVATQTAGLRRATARQPATTAGRCRGMGVLTIRRGGGWRCARACAAPGSAAGSG